MEPDHFGGASVKTTLLLVGTSANYLVFLYLGKNKLYRMSILGRRERAIG
jgi:hypothetical protein